MRWHDVCTIERAGQVTNVYTGEPEGEPDWSAATSTEVPCSIQPRSSIEPDGSVVVAGWLGFFPAGTDLEHTDRIAWRGRLLQVDGDVAPWVRGSEVHHFEVPLKEWSS